MPSDDPSDGNRPRASQTVKLVLMGVAGVGVLYSCTPAIGSAIGSVPRFWFFGNPFYRPPVCGPTVPGNPICPPGQTATSGSGGSGSNSYFRGSSSGGSSSTSSSSSGSSSSSQSTSSRGGFGSSAAAHGSSGS